MARSSGTCNNLAPSAGPPMAQSAALPQGYIMKSLNTNLVSWEVFCHKICMLGLQFTAEPTYKFDAKLSKISAFVYTPEKLNRDIVENFREWDNLQTAHCTYREGQHRCWRQQGWVWTILESPYQIGRTQHSSNFIGWFPHGQGIDGETM